MPQPKFKYNDQVTYNCEVMTVVEISIWMPNGRTFYKLQDKNNSFWSVREAEIIGYSSETIRRPFDNKLVYASTGIPVEDHVDFLNLKIRDTF